MLTACVIRSFINIVYLKTMRVNTYLNLLFIFISNDFVILFIVGGLITKINIYDRTIIISFVLPRLKQQ